jgi:hypothetical protein
VTYEFRSNPITASAMSSGRADRCNGTVAAVAACCSCSSAVKGVATRPGATALTLTGPHDLASRATRWFKAALDMAYAIDEPTGRTPATEVIITTLGSGDWRKNGMAAFVSHQVPNTLTSNVRRKISSVSASRSAWSTSLVQPALLTRMSSRLNRSRVRVTIACPCDWSLMSACTYRASVGSDSATA